MPRLPRVSVPGAVYWVTCRGLDEGQIFKEKADYHMYLDMVAKYKMQHQFRLYAYCLLPDRLELLVEPGDDASISEIMHDLNSLYTKYFNCRHQKRGHLFDARFRSVLVEKATELLSLTRYIHWAPARTQPPPSSVPVSECPYSSFLIYRHTPESPAPATKLDMNDEVREVLSFLKEKDDPAAYAKYVLDADKSELEELEKSLRRGSVHGSESFRETVRKRVEEHAEELKKSPQGRPSRIVLVWIGGIVLLAMTSSVYLYVSRQRIEAQYEALVRQLEIKASADVLSETNPAGDAS